MRVQVSFQDGDFIFFGYIPRGGIAGMLVLIFWEIFILFLSGCTSLHSHQQYTGFPFSLYPYQNLLFLVLLFNNNHSDRCEVVSHVVSICISLMISDVEHLFTCLFAICMSLRKCPFRPYAYFLYFLFSSIQTPGSAHFLIWWWCFLVLFFFFAVELYVFFVYYGWKWSRVWLFATPWTVAYQASPLDFPGKSTGVGCHFLLQETSPTQGLSPGLLHCRQTLHRLSTRGALWVLVFVLSLSRVQLCDPVDCSPPGSSVHGILQARMLEWVAIPFSSIMGTNPLIR